MYPFYVLDVSEDTTDAEVEARYHTLVRLHPPDADPTAFQLVRGAYEALRTAEQRQLARLFYFDRSGRSLTSELPAWLERKKPTRMTEEALARFILAGRS